MTEYWTDFVQESNDRITELNNALLALERNPDDSEAVEKVFRIAHTLKGNCGAAGLESASELAHAIEDLLDAVRAGRLEVSPELMDDVFDAVDQLETMIESVDATGSVETDPSATIRALRDHLERPTPIQSPTDEEIEDVLSRFEPPDGDQNAYFVRLSVDESATDANNAGILIVEALIDAFDLIGTEPPRDSIEANAYDGRFDAVFASAVTEAAIASGLEPVDEVAAFELVDVTEQFEAVAAAPDEGATDDSGLDVSVDPDISPDEAKELDVDELLDEFDRYDDLDELVEEVEDDDDLDAFDNMGKAGSFDDLLDEEDVEVEFEEDEDDTAASDDDSEPTDQREPSSDAAESASESASTSDSSASAASDTAGTGAGTSGSTGPATDSSTVSEPADDSVDDAEAVFQELKDEVEMVGFDELQEELEELEFDEFDTDDEVGMDELLGDEFDDTDDEPFLADTSDDADESAESAEDDESAEADETDETDASDESDESNESEESAEPDESAGTDETDASAEDDGFDEDVIVAGPVETDDTAGDADDGTETAESPAATEDGDVDDDATTESAVEEAEPDDDATAESTVEEAEPDDDATAESTVEEAESDGTEDFGPETGGFEPATENLESPGPETQATPEPSVSWNTAAESSERDHGRSDGVVDFSEFGSEIDEPTDETPGESESDDDDAAAETAAESVDSDEPETTSESDEIEPIDDVDADARSESGSVPDDGSEDADEAEIGAETETKPLEGAESDVTSGGDDEAETDALETTFDGDADDGSSVSESFESNLDDSDEFDASTSFDDDSLDSVGFDDSAADDSVEDDDFGDLESDEFEDDDFAEDSFADDSFADDGSADDFADDGSADDTAEFGTEAMDADAFGGAADADAGFGTSDAETGSTADDASETDDEGRIVSEPSFEIPEISLPDEDLNRDTTDETDEMQSVRVDVEQIDELLTLVEGLVTSRVRLRHAIESGEDRQTLERELGALEDITTELQETVMDVRLVPLETVTNRLPRVVRDIARDQDKEVTFEIHGEDVELDRTILDRISDPLIHLVRNAVDHGIELPDRRADLEKPREGTVEVTAARSRDRVSITVEDDGSGIDPERLRSEAVEADVISEDDAAAMDDEQVYDLVFHPGFSTADEVTDVSGRGVGMDVVKRTVTELDGSVSIDSTPGDGTSVTMTLPVSLAIDDILFLESDAQEFGIPTEVVHDIEPASVVEMRDGEPVLPTSGDSDTDDETDDAAVPVVNLSETLETTASTATASDGGSSNDGADTDDDVVIRIRDDVRPIALRCDRVYGQQEVVVKPFEGFMSGIPGLSGATVRGRGQVVNIIDVTTL